MLVQQRRDRRFIQHDVARQMNELAPHARRALRAVELGIGFGIEKIGARALVAQGVQHTQPILVGQRVIDACQRVATHMAVVVLPVDPRRGRSHPEQ